MTEQESSSMSEGRALLTDREREALAGDKSDSYRYKTRSYFRNRLEKLELDVELLAEHDPELLKELQAVACPRGAPEQHEPDGVALAGGDRDEQPGDTQGEPEVLEEEPDTDDGDLAIPEDPEPEEVVEAVADGWGGPPERVAARKAAAQAVLEYAREHGGVSKQEAKEEVYPEYGVGGQNPRTWYRKNVRPVLNEAAEYNQSSRQYELSEEL